MRTTLACVFTFVALTLVAVGPSGDSRALQSASTGSAVLTGAVRTASGSSSNNTPVVKATLFEAQGNGVRGEFLGSAEMPEIGSYEFSVDEGCYFVVLRAPVGETFTDGSRWFERSRCVEDGGTVTFPEAVIDAGAGEVTIGDQVVDRDGGAVPGVVLNLFAATEGGSRGAFLGRTETDAAGRYRFVAGPGCYVVVFIAPTGATFVNASRFVERQICLASGQESSAIDAVLDVAPASGSAFGFSPGGWFADESDAEVYSDFDRMVEAGATWFRLDFDWSEIERNEGIYHWHRTDRVVDAARSRGLQIIALITESPGWARSPGTLSYSPPDDLGDYARFAAAVVERYGPRGVTTYELWNEPNLGMFWGPHPNPEIYARLVKRAGPAMRAVRSDLTILSGGLAPAADEPDGSGISPTTFTRRMIEAGAGDVFDAYAIHPFSYPARPIADWSAAWNPFHNLPDYHALLAGYGEGHKRIWLTEYGAPTGTSDRAVSEAEQSAQITEALAAAADWSWTGPILLYSHRDSRWAPADFQSNFGLMRHDGTPKRAWNDLIALRGD